MPKTKYRDMPGNDAAQMMSMVRNEILSLRAEIAQLAPKAHAYDQLCAVLDLLPKRSQAYGEDMARRLERAIDDLVMPEPGPESPEKDDQL